MYSISSARKFINQSNALLVESNNLVIDKFSKLILENFEIDKDKLEQLSFNLKDDISKEHLTNVLQKKKKRDGPPRPLNEYNKFVSKNMRELKEQNPEMNATELMKKTAVLWNEEKNKVNEENKA